MKALTFSRFSGRRLLAAGTAARAASNLFSKGCGVFGSLGQGDSLQDVDHLAAVALPEGTSRVLRVSAGWGHSAAITGDGRLLVFGRPYDFSNILQINRMHSFSPDLGRFVGRFTNNFAWFGGGGDSTKQQQQQQPQAGNSKESGIFTVPTYFNLDAVDTVSCSAGLTVALTLDGRVFCFGLNRWGQCGIPGLQHVYEPRLVNLPERIAMVDAGLQHCLAVGHSGKVYAWGKGTRGQLGDGENDTSTTPVVVKGAAGHVSAVAVSAGFNHSAALTADGLVYVWGKGMSLTPAAVSAKTGGGASSGRPQVYEDQPKPRVLPPLGPNALRVKEICSSNFTLVMRASDDSLWAMGIGEEDRCCVPLPVPVQQAAIGGDDLPSGQAVSSPQVLLGSSAQMRKGYQRVLLFDRGGPAAGATTTWSTYADPNERVFEVVLHDGEAFLHPLETLTGTQEPGIQGKRLLDVSHGWRQVLAVLE